MPGHVDGGRTRCFVRVARARSTERVSPETLAELDKHSARRITTSRCLLSRSEHCGQRVWSSQSQEKLTARLGQPLGLCRQPRPVLAPSHSLNLIVDLHGLIACGQSNDNRTSRPLRAVVRESRGHSTPCHATRKRRRLQDQRLKGRT